MQISGEVNFNYKNQAGITALGDRFENICMRIDDFNLRSEKRFLSVGTNLRKYLADSRQLTYLSSEASSTIADEILNKGITQLNSLLDEFGYYIKITTDEIKNDRNELLSILPDVLEITDYLQGFDKIIKQFRMLGISTKIESARLGTEDYGFFALAETVDNLSGLINEKAKAILEKSKFLVGVLNNTTSNLAGLEKEQKILASDIINNISHSSETLKSKFDKKVRQTENISRRSSGISGNIGEIVTSIQFQDITRQRLEHVKSAFEELDSEINSQTESGETENLEEILGRIIDIITLESSQVKNAINEFNGATEKITGNLKGVERNIAGMFSETVELITETGNTALRNVNSELNVVSKGLRKNIEIKSELTASINSVISIVDDLSKYVLEIEDIGTEIELIALNARVKAARAGKNGSALGVLSETIQRLSVDARSQTGSTSHVLNNISSRSKNLRINTYKDKNETGGSNLVSSTDKLKDLLLSLTGFEKKAESNIEILSNRTSLLKSEINSTVKELVDNSDAADLYKAIETELNKIKQEVSSYGNFRSNFSANIENLAGIYTMDYERKTHRNIINQYKREVVENDIVDFGSVDSSLGENVELF